MAGAEGYEGFKIGSPLSGASEKSADLIKIRAITNTVASVQTMLKQARAVRRTS